MTFQFLEGSCVWEASPEVPGGLPCLAHLTKTRLDPVPSPTVMEADHYA